MTQPGKAPQSTSSTTCANRTRIASSVPERSTATCASANLSSTDLTSTSKSAETTLELASAPFAKAHVGAKDVWNNDYHMFWSTTGWDMDTGCVSSSGGSVDPQCCSTDTSAASIFNAYTKECCANGTVKPIGQC